MGLLAADPLYVPLLLSLDCTGSGALMHCELYFTHSPQSVAMRVFCYYNLHRRCFSLKALEGPDKGRVVAHADAVHLTDVTFKVSQAGRARVLREKRKNVHAGAVGTLAAYQAPGAAASSGWTRRARRFGTMAAAVSYNPYRGPSFFDCETGQAVAQAAECLLQDRRALALNAAVA